MAVKRKKKEDKQFLHKKFPSNEQRKLVGIFIFIVLVFVVLIIRVTYVNAKKGSSYTRIVLNQQNYDSRDIPYRRGDIVDRNGTKVATSERLYNVILDVFVLRDVVGKLEEDKREESLDLTTEVLSECFEIEGDEVRRLMEEKPNSMYEKLRTGVSYDAVKRFREIAADKKNYPELNTRGIWFEDYYVRKYPYGSLASDVIGFTYGGKEGALGIEKSYDQILTGTDGREYGYLDSETAVERTTKAPKNGNTVVSTIDVTLQSIVEKHILKFNEEHSGGERKDEPGSLNTSVLIMEPNTGEILAQADYPCYDLNNPWNDIQVLYSSDERSSKLMTESMWKDMSDDEKTVARNKVWKNFSVSSAYEPGSTAKPFTVAAGLETGALTGNETFSCSGYKWVGGHAIGCHLRSGHGRETVQDAVANSCNVALMDMADKIGALDFVRYQHIFGFGEYTGIDLPGEAYTENLLYTAENMKPVDLATCSFGQSFNVTMVQMASAFASLINGGNYYEPHVVRQIQDENGSVIETKNPVLLRKTVSAETSEQAKAYLKAVMDYGTGKRARLDNYDIGAKTGTAQKVPRSANNYLLSFIGYAPQENPEVLIYVVIDKPNVKQQDNSMLVLQLAHDIMEEAFPYLGITTISSQEGAGQ